MLEMKYLINRYYGLVIQIIEKCGFTEEEIHAKLRDLIQEGGITINDTISAIIQLANEVGIDGRGDIDEDEVISERKKRTDLTNFESIEDLDDFLRSKIPRFIKRELIEKARTYKKNKDFKRAKELYKKALDVDGRDLSFDNDDYYEVLVELEEFEEAESLIDVILEDEHNWRGRWALQEKAYLRLLNHDKLKALEIVKKIMSIDIQYKNWIIKDKRFKEIVKTEEFEQFLKPLRRFKVNDYVTVEENIGGVSIYVGNELIPSCNQLSLINPYAEGYFHSFEEVSGVYEDLNRDDEYWGICSCLQAWAENEYNCDFLHETLSLPLMDELCKVGDPLAIKVFPLEIAKMVNMGDYHMHEYLRREDYLSRLTQEELIKGSLNSPDAEVMLEIAKESSLEYSIIGNFDWSDDFRQGWLTENYHFSLEDGHVAELELGLNHMNPMIPKMLNNLKHLKKLYLYLYNVYPIFNELDSLEYLDIWCSGNVVLPDEFDKFPNLLRLFVRTSFRGDNSTSFVCIPDTICKLQHLVWLKLNRVNLKLLPVSIGNLKNLETLDIDNTGLVMLPESIYTLENLEHIEITNNPLTAPEKLKKLEYKFAEKIYDIIQESMPNGISFNALQEKLRLDDYKILRGLHRLEDRVRSEQEIMSNILENRESLLFIK